MEENVHLGADWVLFICVLASGSQLDGCLKSGKRVKFSQI